MKIGTWNIGSLWQDYNKNIELFREVILLHHPDMLILQEFIPDKQLLDVIYKAIGLKCSYYKEFSKSHVAINKYMGIAVFSNYQISENDIYKLVKPNKTFYHNGKAERFHDKYFISLTVTSKKTKINVITGHGYSFRRYGIEPTDFTDIFVPLDSWICSNVINQKSLIAGDFNADNLNQLLPNLCRNYFDIFKGCPTRPSGRKSDCILLPNGNEYSETVNICRGTYNPRTGFDHNYIGATINISSQFLNNK